MEVERRSIAVPFIGILVELSTAQLCFGGTSLPGPALGFVAEQVFERGDRAKLRRMVDIYMDPRVAVRADASDVVQEALAEAAIKLPEFARQGNFPFDPWLRQLAWERLVQRHRRHIGAEVMKEHLRDFRKRTNRRPRFELHVGVPGSLAGSYICFDVGCRDPFSLLGVYP